MSDNLYLDRITNLRSSLRAEQRASLIQIMDELLEILGMMEFRLRTLEKSYEEND